MFLARYAYQEPPRRTPDAADEIPEVEMDEHAVVAARHSLHAVAERLLAGPQYREHGEIRLQVPPGGFGQFAGPLRVEGTEIVSGAGECLCAHRATPATRCRTRTWGRGCLARESSGTRRSAPPGRRTNCPTPTPWRHSSPPRRGEE